QLPLKYAFPHKVVIGRLRLFAALLAVLVILGSLSLGIAGITRSGQAQGRVQLALSPVEHHQTPSVGHTPRPAPTHTPRPAIKPDPTPIIPFPSSLPQQLALLKTHDRFLYFGNRLLPEVALTFDDGPTPYY